MTRFSIYIDRPNLVAKTQEALEGSPVKHAWLMCETARGKLLVESGFQAKVLVNEWREDGELEAVVWPRDGDDHIERYAHLKGAGMLLRADVEGQDRDGHIENADLYDGGVTSYPFHKIVKDWQHPAGEEVQVYPIRGGDLEDYGADAVDWALDLTGASSVALPLWKLSDSDGANTYGSERGFLRELVERCLLRGVEEVSFWSAKHLWKNDYALPFLIEDLASIGTIDEPSNSLSSQVPELVPQLEELRPKPEPLDLAERVARLEEQMTKLLQAQACPTEDR